MKRSMLAVAALLAMGLLAGVSYGEERGGPVVKTFRGSITKIEAGSVTITAKKDSGEKSVTLKTDADTKVQLPTDEQEAGGEGGMKAKYKDGAVSDLKEGDRVQATYGEDEVAKTITVQAPPKKREGGEGEAPKAPPVEEPKERKEG